ncbi:hypothetical protein GOP47_0028901 [Adiantum capillus-veneris]|nr:hypothetical protein GOP47_0028901 [Adiantum capillus-veneris]
MRRCATSLQRCGEGADRFVSCSSWLDSLWKDFFRDPSQWWDNRTLKPSPAYPDFVHKDSRQGLWLHSFRNSSWLSAELRRHGLFDAPSVDTQILYFTIRLKACARSKDLLTGTRLHHNLVRMRLIDGTLKFVCIRPTNPGFLCLAVSKQGTMFACANYGMSSWSHSPSKGVTESPSRAADPRRHLRGAWKQA